MKHFYSSIFYAGDASHKCFLHQVCNKPHVYLVAKVYRSNINDDFFGKFQWFLHDPEAKLILHQISVCIFLDGGKYLA